jgi:hypothetical protein
MSVTTDIYRNWQERENQYELHLLLAKRSRSRLPLVLKDTQCAAKGAAIDMYGN